ncbi:hypothetical protein SYJ56_08825 [Algoriphagus sp. D3-2-R+10]|uniref:hypothetical protein n=1 Tax=Algoriphagus aurantiacus TaxID=3103948 RepID=UPI002B3898FA|nr:hypothetical protein [Algoriphagus sp. D3-2-R+10]MEB2775409.1 hypothetical protein [Algoriphagus sp. D3-2-R+10]
MKKVLLFGALFACIVMSGFAQEATEEVTTEELTKFANMEVEFENFLNSRTEKMKSMILDNEIFQGGARYNEIKAAWGDEAKMTEAKVTPEEIAAYEEVQAFQDSQQDVLKEYKTDLIMNDSILGASTYNKVNGATKEDPALKEKLDSLIAELKAKQAAENADTTKVIDGK